MSKPNLLNTDIIEIADLGPVCNSCGASSIAVRIVVGNFSPVIGICYGAGHAWHIQRGTLAFQEWEKKKVFTKQ